LLRVWREPPTALFLRSLISLQGSGFLPAIIALITTIGGQALFSGFERANSDRPAMQVDTKV